MTVVLGVDGGGTKTHVLVADHSGALLGASTGGITNWEDVGIEAAGAALRAAVLEADCRGRRCRAMELAVERHQHLAVSGADDTARQHDLEALALDPEPAGDEPRGDPEG